MSSQIRISDHHYAEEQIDKCLDLECSGPVEVQGVIGNNDVLNAGEPSQANETNEPSIKRKRNANATITKESLERNKRMKNLLVSRTKVVY